MAMPPFISRHRRRQCHGVFHLPRLSTFRVKSLLSLARFLILLPLFSDNISDDRCQWCALPTAILPFSRHNAFRRYFGSTFSSILDAFVYRYWAAYFIDCCYHGYLALLIYAFFDDAILLAQPLSRLRDNTLYLFDSLRLFSMAYAAASASCRCFYDYDISFLMPFHLYSTLHYLLLNISPAWPSLRLFHAHHYVSSTPLYYFLDVGVLRICDFDILHYRDRAHTFRWLSMHEQLFYFISNTPFELISASPVINAVIGDNFYSLAIRRIHAFSLIISFVVYIIASRSCHFTKFSTDFD